MPDGQRRLLFVLANGGRGGMQSQVRLLAGALAARGCAVTVVVGGGDLDPVDGVDVVAIAPFRARRPFEFLRALRREVRRRRPEIVHGHGLRLAPLLPWCGARHRLVTCHGLDPARAAATARRVRRSRVPVASCGEGPRAVLARHGLSSHVLNNAVVPPTSRHDAAALRATFGLVPDVPLVVLPARFSHQKNHEGLLRALTLVRDALGERAPEVVCCGDGPLRDATIEGARRSGERPLVRVVDHLDDAASWFAATDFFVLTSHWEGQPMVVLEALAAGLPVATTTPTGVEDLLLDGHNARVVQGDAALAAVLVEWTTTPAARPRDETLTASILAAHTVDAVRDAHLAFYDTLVARR